MDHSEKSLKKPLAAPIQLGYLQPSPLHFTFTGNAVWDAKSTPGSSILERSIFENLG
jgi:hypothetical protein